ncbi:hypothetical protein TRFO_20071 [Tritrichomonas foetus]|uniref:Uncharacterized protein n=1 Tax=Tritrichomonas foetus TaxID=1144522 RepID=A0A1J4KGT0_9EUKA|nr:hypothetical protein TRFO_20071 [Tritrichomonas foetus]|eukprot:OHT10577.1 hypothetical protein TRFO_20071 [Tritrichomonas foetus]
MSASPVNSPRSIHSPKQASPKDTRPFIYLYKVEFPDNPPKRIRMPKDMKELLSIATDILELQRPATQVFDSNDDPVTEFEKIIPKANLYISSAKPHTEEDDEFIYNKTSRVYKDPLEGLKKLPTVKQPKVKPVPEDANTQCTIAACPLTVKQNLRNAIISLYASLTPDHITHLNCAETMTKLTKETQIFEFENALLSQYIAPTTVINHTPLGQQTTNWMMEKLKGLPAEDCRFIITGPSQSGKSTLLHIAASLFFNKLQLAGETIHFLMFPLNWLLHQIYIDDVVKLYHLFVKTTLDMLQICRLEFIPLMQSLTNWLFNLITIPGLPAMPPTLSHFPDFPVHELNELGKRIHNTWFREDGFHDFVEEIVNFPNNLAKIFGFISAIYVYDHFDACGYQINVPVEQFPAPYQEPVNLSELICDSLKGCPFFIASQNDGDFFNIFSVQEFHQLSTERLIASKGERELVVLQAKVLITMDMCRGCPAYCALFNHVCDLAAEVTRRAALKSQFSKLKSVVDIARNEQLKQEFIRMCILLGAADTDGHFDENKMNELMSMPEISIRVR